MNAEREKEKGNHTGTTERQFGKGRLNCNKPRARQTLIRTRAHTNTHRGTCTQLSKVWSGSRCSLRALQLNIGSI